MFKLSRMEVVHDTLGKGEHLPLCCKEEAVPPTSAPLQSPAQAW